MTVLCITTPSTHGAALAGQTAVSRRTGCMIGPRHVFKASQCVAWASDGSAGWKPFSPVYYNCTEPWSAVYATKIYSLTQNN
ncbi:uncharacterized protein A1O9_11387 [Exophiala aquamarina CBS 119918]|uniref:Uncharacterized protein n=1 Tax=Exophiala aquamarina CBS 119918 TaxID=1182545 RepID=A0A072PAC7_9EURO|nr:uncharacterized protein A1O9_11387 [Exophiala aquamarina CBS 119918]KEF52545.1 hypothetical protein A1O9_11387 [Exophiala aquamarina CBS 119918]